MKHFFILFLLITNITFAENFKAPQSTAEDYKASDEWWQKQSQILKKLKKHIEYVNGKEILVDDVQTPPPPMVIKKRQRFKIIITIEVDYDTD
jgi:hypothetical protein